ncbi:hypothetical protein AMTR_s00070p00146500 [Amborella trichopoda]|uniref:Uncharacterized protein n=1 Tax=Amborella trichopoda TaxID=13333 RepID=U5DJ59_AMBTC|nr:hypothetical protein AMTR_s00070p00146500 [Amborella trichopoda]
MAQAGEVSITLKTNRRSMVEVLGTRAIDIARTYNRRGVSEWREPVRLVSQGRLTTGRWLKYLECGVLTSRRCSIARL